MLFRSAIRPESLKSKNRVGLHLPCLLSCDKIDYSRIPGFMIVANDLFLNSLVKDPSSNLTSHLGHISAFAHSLL